MSRMARILHVTWKMEIGGQERAIYQLIREQRKCGLEADLLVGSGGGLYLEKTRAAGARIHDIGQKSSLDYPAAARMKKILRDYDVAHFHSAEPFPVMAAARDTRIRAYYSHRAGRFRYPARKLLRYRFVGHYIRRGFAGVSGNTGQAAEAAAALFRLPRERVRTIYNGIDFSLLEPVRPREAVLAELGSGGASLRVGTSGNLRAWKRIDLLLRAAAMLKDEPIRWHVIGDGPDRARLEAIARRLGIDRCVSFPGKKEQIGDYLQALDLFVLPSGPEESFGNSAVEAMGVGLPTLVFSDGGGLLEHVREGETGFVVRDVDELARRIAELARDSGLRRRIGGAGRRFVRERYSLEAMVRNYNAFYTLGRETGNDG